jgi:transcriptional regulatory protein RtcR
VQSDFQLIAGTNRDLACEVAAGRFREDLFARINLWTYSLPSLAERPEDIEPNLDYLLEQASVELGHATRFNKESRAAFVRYATSAAATWRGNFRDLYASVTRMATLADAGRITVPVVDAEIGRLRKLWREPSDMTGQAVDIEALLGTERTAQLDLFDKLQLQAVVQACAGCDSLSDAGRKLFSMSRAAKAKPNDADRLKKFLARHDLTWEDIRRRP